MVVQPAAEPASFPSPGHDASGARARRQESRHVVHFYEDDAFLLDILKNVCRDASLNGEAAVVIARPQHLTRLRAWLDGEAADDPNSPGAQDCITEDAAETLARFMVDGRPDPERFGAAMRKLIPAAGGRPVRVFGEMVAILVEEGKPEAAVALEALWNDLQGSVPFSLTCAYPLRIFADEGRDDAFRAICAAHDLAVPTERYLTPASEAERLREIAALQQKSQRLETETARRRRAEFDLREALAEAEAARHQAESALRARDAFLAVAAHEMCNPLTGLSLHTQVALKRLERDRQLEPERVGHVLHAISGQTARLSRLVERLLDATRLEAGTLALERQVVDVGLLVADAVERARGWSARTILLESPGSLIAHVDAGLFQQLLANLLDNAIKFSDEDAGIEVALSAPAAMGRLTVRDYGPGIAPDLRERLFERFAHARGDQLAHGLGLGLYISREIAALHGGQIHAEFPEEGGSRFVVSFPLGDDDAPAPAVSD